MRSFKYLLAAVALAAFIAACGTAKGKTQTATYGTGLAPKTYGTGTYGTGGWRNSVKRHHATVKGV
jgi:hypothetical protein